MGEWGARVVGLSTPNVSAAGLRCAERWGEGMSKTLAGLLREFNVEVIDNRQNHSRKARQTCAGKTLSRVFRLRGYDHLRSVLMSICETRPNKRALVAPVIWAISDVLHAYPDWFGDTWLTTMDGTHLAELFERASANRRIAQPRAAIATLIFERMRPHFPDRPQRAAAAKRPAGQPVQMAA
jgi:hypothetical protein